MLAKLFRGVVDDPTQRFPGFFDRCFESTHFSGTAILHGHVLFDDIHPLFIHEVGFADANPRGSADPLEDDFLGS
jgi:hypothetical protein